MDMPQHDASQPFQNVSIAPLLQFYAGQIDAWRKACEQLLSEAHAAPHGGSKADAFAAQVASTQAEFCKFLTHGLEEYQKVIQTLPQCRSPEEALQLQMSFLSRMVTACMAEAGRLAQPFMTMAGHPEKEPGA
jgi:hypothetical protein